MSSSEVRRTLIAYDIPDDARRGRVAKILESYGDRVQYSVFVVDAPPVRVNRLRRALAREIEGAEDSILLCDLGVAEGVEIRRFQYLGRQRPITDKDSFVL